MNRKLTVSFLGLFVAACSSVPTSNAVVDVPDKLKPQSNETLALIVPAKGVQIYECRAKTDQADSYAWAFVAPDADLFDSKGRQIGRHYAGPQWESTDGSRIAGAVKESAAAPRSEAIPWLLLAAKSVGVQGSFSQVTSVQRVNTVGGVAPTSGCSAEAAGKTARVPYTADYYFLKRN